MAPLTSRGKVVLGLAFLLSAALCAGAAVALVKASDHEPTGGGTAAPTPQTTRVLGTPSPTPSASPDAVRTSAPPSPTAAATSAAPSPTPSPRATVSATRSPAPRPRPTTSPRPAPPAGLYVRAAIDQTSGFVGEEIVLTVHATDGKGKISLLSLDWGDGVVDTHQSTKPGTSCSKAKDPQGSDCRDFTFTHHYERASNGTPFTIELRMTSTDESAEPITFDVTIRYQPGESPTPTGSSGS